MWSDDIPPSSFYTFQWREEMHSVTVMSRNSLGSSAKNSNMTLARQPKGEFMSLYHCSLNFSLLSISVVHFMIIILFFFLMLRCCLSSCSALFLLSHYYYYIFFFPQLIALIRAGCCLDTEPSVAAYSTCCCSCDDSRLLPHLLDVIFLKTCPRYYDVGLSNSSAPAVFFLWVSK